MKRNIEQGALKLDNATKVRKIVFIGLSINMALTILKFTAGLVGHSQALLADAIHSLTDSITDLTVIIGSYYWGKPPDEQHPHGHQRIETLVTILIGIFIFVAGVSMGWHAIATLHTNKSVEPNSIALGMVLISMFSKEILCRWTLAFGRKFSSTILIASAWEHRSDALGSIPTFFAILGAINFPDWTLLDNVGAIIVCMFIINTSFKILAPRVQELLEHGAPGETLAKINKIVNSCPGVINIHRARTRYLGANLLLDFHLLVAADITVKQGHDIAEKVKEMLFQQLPDLTDVIVHVEPHDHKSVKHQDD